MKLSKIHTLILLPLLATACRDEVENNDFNRYSSSIVFSTTADTRAAGDTGGPSFNGDTDETRTALQQPNTSEHKMVSPDGKDTTSVTVCVSDWDAETEQEMRTRGALMSSNFQFGVKCVKKYSNADSHYFCMDDVQYNGTAAETTTNYYWLGSSYQFRFLAYHPTNLLTDTQKNGNTFPENIEYNVPANVVNQQDLMLAHPQYQDQIGTGVDSYYYPGNHNQTIHFRFHHLCTAVQFKMGNDMLSGATITKIEINGIKTGGTYNVANKTWTFNGTGTQTVVCEQNMPTSNNAVYNDGNYYFILPPQDLSDVTVTITYRYGQAVKEISGSLNVGGIQWQSGKRIVYSFNISPELTIGVADIQDAHYTMVEIPFNVVGLSGTNRWTISSDQSWCTMRSQLVGPETSGYWISSWSNDASEFNRTTSISNTGNGEKSVWLFLAENATNENRTVNITLSTPSKSITTTVTQLCPSWTGPNGEGWERLEDDGTYPFGFNWTRKVDYRMTGFGANISLWLIQYSNPTTSDMVEPYNNFSFNLSNNYAGVRIDYTKANNLVGATTDSDGSSNTNALYNAAGGALDAYEQIFINDSRFVVYSEEGSNEQTDDYAALIALKCNPFTVTKETNSGNVAYKLSISADAIKWFLPAPNQFVCGDVTYPMNGTYWTSNAIDTPNANSMVMTNNTAAPVQSSHRTNDYYKVRAMRITN